MIAGGIKSKVILPYHDLIFDTTLRAIASLERISGAEV